MTPGEQRGIDLEHVISIYACDIDGCLVAAGHQDFDLERLEALASLNAASSSDPAIPSLTLVTGRPHAYVDALTQLLGIDLPVSFENGAGLATRRPYRWWLASGFEELSSELKAFADLIEEQPRMVLQPGKIASQSVFPTDQEYDLGDLKDDLADLLRAADLSLLLDPSTDCVNVLVPGIDKATGFEWLLGELGVAPQEVAGIGDSVGDLGWLLRCAVSFAPANAVPEVAAAVDLPLDGDDVTAAVTAYELLIESNRRLLGG